MIIKLKNLLTLYVDGEIINSIEYNAKKKETNDNRSWRIIGMVETSLQNHILRIGKLFIMTLVKELSFYFGGTTSTILILRRAYEN